MSNTLTIELALSLTDPRRGSRQGSSLKNRRGSTGNRPLTKMGFLNSYDIVTIRNPLPESRCPDHYPEAFFESLDLVESRKELLRWVVWYLCEYLNTLTDQAYDISESYAYFAVTDEHEKTIYSTPHITSPVLFDPNEKEGVYEIVLYEIPSILHSNE